MIIHKGLSQRICDVCQLEFVSNVSLRRHYSVHTRVKAFKCNICQRSFSQDSHLKSHIRLRTGERPFKCHQCAKTFNHNLSLKNHIQRFHTANCQSKQKDKETGMEPETDEAEGRGEHNQSDNATEKCESKNVGTKLKKRSTGRPLGRPKGTAHVAVKKADQCSNPEIVKERLPVGQRNRGRITWRPRKVSERVLKV